MRYSGSLSLAGNTAPGKRCITSARPARGPRHALLHPALRRLAQVTTLPSAAPVIDLCGGRPDFVPAVDRPASARAPRLLLPSGLAVLVVCLAGLFAYRFVASVGADQPRGFNIFFVLYNGH